jgi:hypothetical protein
MPRPVEDRPNALAARTDQHGQAEVEVGKERFPVRATAVASGPEHDRLYEAQARVMPGFRTYQERATRIIPVVVLERVEPAEMAA